MHSKSKVECEGQDQRNFGKQIYGKKSYLEFYGCMTMSLKKKLLAGTYICHCQNMEDRFLGLKLFLRNCLHLSCPYGSLSKCWG